MNTPRLTITKFGRDAGGYYTARVTHHGETYEVDKRWGSWQRTSEVAGHKVRREVPFAVAEALQAKLPAQDRKRAADRKVTKP